MLKKTIAKVIATFAAAALVFGALLVPAYAAANDDDTVQTLYYDPQENPVADRTVHVNVGKIDGTSHEYLPGATLQIIDKETGEVVVEWKSGEGMKKFDRAFDIEHEYILHEVSAPDGYNLAEDVTFTLKSVNFETKGEVLSGAKTKDGVPNAEFQDVAGDIENQAFVISLYDIKEGSEYVEKKTIVKEEDKVVYDEKTITRQNEEERVNTVTRNRNGETGNENETGDSSSNSNTVTNSRSETTSDSNSNQGANSRGGGSLTRTGDETSYVPVVVIAVLGVGLIAFALVRRKEQ